ncbi:MAG: hypothetical protein M3Q97_06695 [Bacteroidota bacterium]|nr:hypothetical protein [Bacteroidota bacterium]
MLRFIPGFAKVVFVGLALSGLFLLPGCQSDLPVNDDPDIVEIENGIADDRAGFESEVSKRTEEMRSDLRHWQADSVNANNEPVAKLKSAIERIDARMDELSTATDTEWQALKDDIDRELMELEAQYKELKTEIAD